MTPEEIEVLIRCHVSPTTHPRISEPAVQQAIRMFEAGGIVRKDSDLKGIYNECNRLRTKKDTHREVELYITELEKSLNQAKDEIQCLKRKIRNCLTENNLPTTITPIFTNRKFQRQAIG